MILVRIEPEVVGPVGMNTHERQERWLSPFHGDKRQEMLESFKKRAMGDMVGCWFSPALATTNGTIDALQYVNDIIGPDHNFGNQKTNIRILAIDVDDETASSWKVSNLPAESYARKRSMNPESEYLLPSNLPEMAKQILLLSPNEILTEERYKEALLNFTSSILKETLTQSAEAVIQAPQSPAQLAR